MNTLKYLNGCNIDTFPFIEEDFDSLTMYELYCKMNEKINDVIKETNQTIDELKSLIKTGDENTLIEAKKYTDENKSKANNLVVTTVKSPLGGYRCDYSSSEIRNAIISGKVVEMRFDDIIENSGEQVYAYLKFQNNIAYFRRIQVLETHVRQIDIKVNYDKSVDFDEVIYRKDV